MWTATVDSHGWNATLGFARALARGNRTLTVGPLVEYQNQEKPLSIAFREINDGLLEETLGEDDLTEGN